MPSDSDSDLPDLSNLILRQIASNVTKKMKEEYKKSAAQFPEYIAGLRTRIANSAPGTTLLLMPSQMTPNATQGHTPARILSHCWAIGIRDLTLVSVRMRMRNLAVNCRHCSRPATVILISFTNPRSSTQWAAIPAAGLDFHIIEGTIPLRYC